MERVLPSTKQNIPLDMQANDLTTYGRDEARLSQLKGVKRPSDEALISTQEDVIRQPMLNHVAAFSNDVIRAYLMVDFGYMPPNRRLKPEEIAQLKEWLDHKP